MPLKPLKRICLDDKEYERNAKKIIHKFKQRGYKEKELQKTLELVTDMDRDELRNGNKNKKTVNSLIFITTYDDHSKIITKAIKNAWHILQSDDKHG